MNMKMRSANRKYRHMSLWTGRTLRKEIRIGIAIIIILMTILLFHLHSSTNFNINKLIINNNYGEVITTNGGRVYHHSIWEREHAVDGASTVIVKWNFTDKELVMRVEAKTKGYVGVGFSYHNNMTQADIVIGWIKDGNPFLQDYYALNNGQPLKDKQQDYELLYAQETETHTILCFKRKLDTCDQNDIIITWNTMRLLWATHEEDPSVADGPLYHGMNRGFNVTHIMGLQYQLPTSSDIEFIDILSENVTIKTKKSDHYFCRMYKIPDVGYKTHMVGYKAVIQAENEDKVHHMLLYLCNTTQIRTFTEEKEGHNCFKTINDYACLLTELASFAVGSQQVIYPPTLGYSFSSTQEDPLYVTIQIHYHWQGLIEDFKDNSGFRLFYTRKRRQYDVDTINIAADYPQILPPSQPAFSNFGICPGKCTQVLFPEGVHVIGYHFHAHLTAKIGRFRVFRNGEEIFRVSDEHYDYHFQQPNFLKEPVHVLPNDTIAVECIYDTTDRNSTITTGPTTENEMCIMHLVLYPPVPYYFCSSRLFYKDLPKIMEDVPDIWRGRERNFGFLENLHTLATSYIIHNHSWTIREAEELRRMNRFGSHLTTCKTFNGLEDVQIELPESEPYKDEDVCESL